MRVHDSPSLTDAFAECRVVPRPRLHPDLEKVARQVLPRQAYRYVDGKRETLIDLESALRNYHDDALAPYWPQLRAHLDADRALRGRIMADGGVEALLTSLHPTLKWESPVLQLPCPSGIDLHLGGRGLLLLPSIFIGSEPLFFRHSFNPDDSPVVLYPAPVNPTTALGLWATPDQGTFTALIALVGRTRAAVLETIADGCITTELASRLGISPASASEHATVLRSAGLVLSQRQRNTVQHTLTPLGVGLLNTRTR
jgi:DNA-binding transcriptional ArsR family regulator